MISSASWGRQPTRGTITRNHQGRDDSHAPHARPGPRGRRPGGHRRGLDILWIAGAELWAGFELTGTATLAWTGALPAQSRLAFQVKVAHLGAVPADGATWGGLKALWR